MTEEPGPEGPCTGLRVIDFATMVSGPFAGQMLGDLGAEVIKVEPVGGDPMRALHPQHEGMSALFLQVNRNKKSIGLDLKNPDGLGIARDLALSADVVIENFRPGVMDRLGLGYQALKEGNPGLIFVSVSGFGPAGPYIDRPAYDHVIQGMSGMMRALGGDGAPVPVRNAIVDKAASMAAVNGVLAALLYRVRSGAGQFVSVSLLDAFSAFVLPDVMINHTFQTEGSEKIRDINIYRPIATSDGHVIGHIQLNSQFEGLCRTVGREDLIGDPRFKDAWSRLSNYEEMWREMEQGAKKLTTRQIVEDAASNHVPLGPVNHITQFFEDPQVRHNRTWYDYEDPDYGTIRQLAYPVSLSASPARLETRGPRLGEQTDEILRGIGRSEGDIARARAGAYVS